MRLNSAATVSVVHSPVESDAVRVAGANAAISGYMREEIDFHFRAGRCRAGTLFGTDEDAWRDIFSAAERRSRRALVGAFGRAAGRLIGLAVCDAQPVEAHGIAQASEHAGPAAGQRLRRKGELQALGGGDMARIGTEEHARKNFVLRQLRRRTQLQVRVG